MNLNDVEIYKLVFLIPVISELLNLCSLRYVRDNIIYRLTVVELYRIASHDSNLDEILHLNLQET